MKVNIQYKTYPNNLGLTNSYISGSTNYYI